MALWLRPVTPPSIVMGRCCSKLSLLTHFLTPRHLLICKCRAHRPEFKMLHLDWPSGLAVRESNKWHWQELEYESKLTFCRPTIRPLEEVVSAYNALAKPLQNNSELNSFLTTYFGRAGSELSPVPESELQTDPTFLANVSSPDVSDFVRQVIDIWPDLTRRYVGGANCSGCVNSFIPVNRTFVVAGGTC